MNNKIISIIVIAVSLIAVAIWWILPEANSYQHIKEEPKGGDFVLESYSGPVALQDFRGKVVVLFFGYTRCPDVCPTNMAVMAQVLRGLTEAEREQVIGLFVSVDPDRDSLENLNLYAQFFHPNIFGVTGTAEQVKAVADLYGASYFQQESDSKIGYLVQHTAKTYFIGQEGQLLGHFEHAAPADETITRIRQQLNNGATNE